MKIIKTSKEYKEGESAALQGVVVGDNPYSEYDDEHWQWTQGWVDIQVVKINKMVKGKPEKQEGAGEG